MKSESFKEEQYFVAASMRKNGNTFIKNLGKTLSRADYLDALKIKNTWPELWKMHYKIGQMEFLPYDY